MNILILFNLTFILLVSFILLEQKPLVFLSRLKNFFYFIFFRKKFKNFYPLKLTAKNNQNVMIPVPNFSVYKFEDKSSDSFVLVTFVIVFN